MIDKIVYLIPELVLFLTVCIVMLLGTSRSSHTRGACQIVTAIGLFFAFVASGLSPAIDESLIPGMAPLVRCMVCAVGLLLVFGTGSIDAKYEREIEDGSRTFDALDTARGEYYAFFMLSIIGVMLCTVATDLIWLFLALELTSLPTYIMVATSRGKCTAHEAAIKYFYLGAVAAAFFLYGFAMLYGATGSLHLVEIREAFVSQTAATGSINMLGVLGLVLALVGVFFKIAAFPMYFYTADVYDGAAAHMSAFLAFVPKTAGFVVIMLLLSLVYGLAGSTGSSVTPANDAWPAVIHAILWIVAVLTMTIGNTLAILQTRTKRVLAYSSIAHSGYMLIGIIAGPHAGGGSGLSNNGFAAVLFYLLCYGVMNVGTFLVLGCFTKSSADGDNELETFDDLRGIARQHPWLSGVLAICSLSLLGLPPLLGFFGKIYLFQAGISAGEIVLVVIAGLNSAISAWYYLRLAGLPWLANPTSDTAQLELSPYLGRRFAALLSAAGVIGLLFVASPLMHATNRAIQLSPDKPAAAHHADAAADVVNDNKNDHLDQQQPQSSHEG